MDNVSQKQKLSSSRSTGKYRISLLHYHPKMCIKSNIFQCPLQALHFPRTQIALRTRDSIFMSSVGHSIRKSIPKLRRSFRYKVIKFHQTKTWPNMMNHFFRSDKQRQRFKHQHWFWWRAIYPQSHHSTVRGQTATVYWISFQQLHIRLPCILAGRYASCNHQIGVPQHQHLLSRKFHGFTIPRCCHVLHKRATKQCGQF